MTRRIGAALAALSLSGSYPAFCGDAVTIYSTGTPAQVGRHGGQGAAGYAVVRHERQFSLKPGRNELKFVDVAAQIDPTTVSFSSLTDPGGTRVTWSDRGEFPAAPHWRLLGHLFAERMLGGMFETGLASLKRVVEEPASAR